MRLEPISLASKSGVLSLDLEYDYGGQGLAALHRFDELVCWLQQRHLVATIFVEGRVLRHHPGIVDTLKALALNGFDVAMHCFDHTKVADDFEDLKRGQALFSEALGRPPLGYRASDFRFSKTLVFDLMMLGFAWDSSVLPARFGIGALNDRAMMEALRRADAVRVFGGAVSSARTPPQTLIEWPVGVLGRVSAPIHHSYQLLIGSLLSKLLISSFRLGRLHVHDMHLSDVFRHTESLTLSRANFFQRALHRVSWRQQSDSLGILDDLIASLQASGHRLSTLQELYTELPAAGTPAAVDSEGDRK